MTASDLNALGRILASLEWFPEASRPSGVLVVTADLDLRLSLGNHLENLGYCVWTAGCGSDAFQIAAEHPVAIDVLVCDDSFADLPVPELYRRLKGRSPGMRCCVLAMSKERDRACEAERLGAVVLHVGGGAAAEIEGQEFVHVGGKW